MRRFTMFRFGTAAVTAGLLVVGSLAGTALGCGSSSDVEGQNEGLNVGENSDQSGNDGDNAPETSSSTETLLDEEVELVDNYSDPIEVEVPEDVYSIGISVVDGDGNLNYMITDWQAPDGFELVPADWENDQGQVCYPDCNNRVMMSPGAFGGLAANNPDAEPGVQPGTHQFRVHSSDVETGGMFSRQPGLTQTAETVRVTVHAEVVEDEAPETGEVDLNLFFTGAQGWSAASAPDDQQLQNIIDEIDELYDQVGIDIGEVAYHDVEGDYAVLEELFSGTGDMAQLMAQSERAELEGPSIFFVEELMSPLGGGGGGGGVLGISGGIPGPMIVDGSARSGVAIGTDSASASGAPGIAKVTAHELGHYLGLYHTSEQIGGFGNMPEHDPLPDTPENDTSLLMHATGEGTDLSEGQGRVMRKNPWVEIE